MEIGVVKEGVFGFGGSIGLSGTMLFMCRARPELFVV